jgi:membrane protease YdiL (CAAX protease family)
LEPEQTYPPAYGKAGGRIADRREQLIEVAAFLFLIVPSLALSFFAVDQGNIGFALTAAATILRDLSLLCLIFFFLWRNREPFIRVGWTSKHIWRDIILGVVLFVPVTFGAAWLESALQAIGFSVPSTPLPSLEPTRTAAEMMLAVVLIIVVALTEETIFRGYLMLRFTAVTSSPVWSLLLAAAAFSLGHGYEGTAGVLTVGTMGLVFGLVYTWRKSLVAPVVMHFLQDFLSIVLLPLLVGR